MFQFSGFSLNINLAPVSYVLHSFIDIDHNKPSIKNMLEKRSTLSQVKTNRQKKDKYSHQ